jgi:hypothetical protein
VSGQLGLDDLHFPMYRGNVVADCIAVWIAVLVDVLIRISSPLCGRDMPVFPALALTCSQSYSGSPQAPSVADPLLPIGSNPTAVGLHRQVAPVTMPLLLQWLERGVLC